MQGIIMKEDLGVSQTMNKDELKKVIADIYPDQTQFYVIEFKCL